MDQKQKTNCCFYHKRGAATISSLDGDEVHQTLSGDDREEESITRDRGEGIRAATISSLDGDEVHQTLSGDDREEESITRDRGESNCKSCPPS